MGSSLCKEWKRCFQLERKLKCGAKMAVFHTWKNLAEKVHFLLEVSMRELLVSWFHKILAGVEEILWKTALPKPLEQMWFVKSEQQQDIVRNLTWMASNPQYSLASSNKGTSACSKRVVPHVFKMKRLLETNMLLSLWMIRTGVNMLRLRQFKAGFGILVVN